MQVLEENAVQVTAEESWLCDIFQDALDAGLNIFEALASTRNEAREMRWLVDPEFWRWLAGPMDDATWARCMKYQRANGTWEISHAMATYLLEREQHLGRWTIAVAPTDRDWTAHTATWFTITATHMGGCGMQTHLSFPQFVLVA